MNLFNVQFLHLSILLFPSTLQSVAFLYLETETVFHTHVTENSIPTF